MSRKITSKIENLRKNKKIEEKLLLPCIYKATSKTTGKSYIGQSEYGLYLRKQKHFKRFSRGTWGCKNKFYLAIKKLGWKDFIWEILYIIESEVLTLQEILTILNKKEIEYIIKYNTQKEGYNYNKGGGHTVCFDYSNMTPEEKAFTKRRNHLANRKKKRSTVEYRTNYNARQKAKRIFEKTNYPEEYQQKIKAKRIKYKEQKSAYHKTREWLDKHNARVAKRRLKNELK